MKIKKLKIYAAGILTATVLGLSPKMEVFAEDDVILENISEDAEEATEVKVVAAESTSTDAVATSTEEGKLVWEKKDDTPVVTTPVEGENTGNNDVVDESKGNTKEEVAAQNEEIAEMEDSFVDVDNNSVVAPDDEKFDTGVDYIPGYVQDEWERKGIGDNPGEPENPDNPENTTTTTTTTTEIPGVPTEVVPPVIDVPKTGSEASDIVIGGVCIGLLTVAGVMIKSKRIEFAMDELNKVTGARTKYGRNNRKTR